MKFKLGDKVVVKGRVDAEKTWSCCSYSRQVVERTLQRREITPQEGIICGKRALWEGFSEFIDEQWVFQRHRSIPCYLVAMDMCRMIRALEDDVSHRRA
jgi:hypothetical protein